MEIGRGVPYREIGPDVPYWKLDGVSRIEKLDRMYRIGNWTGCPVWKIWTGRPVWKNWTGCLIWRNLDGVSHMEKYGWGVPVPYNAREWKCEKREREDRSVHGILSRHVREYACTYILGILYYGI